MSGSNQSLSLSAPEFPLDKIFYKLSGSLAVAKSANPIAPTVVSTTVTNPENTTFFVDMQVSPDNSIWYDSGLEPYYKDGVTLNIHKRFAGYWHMTSSVITLAFYANDASYTLYYRLVGYSKV